MANRNSRARGVTGGRIIGGPPTKPSPFDQFVGVFLQTLGKKLIPRIQGSPDEGFRTEYGFAGFDQGVLIFNVTWVPREQAEKEGLYERAKADSEARTSGVDDPAGDTGSVVGATGATDGQGGEPEGQGAGGAAEGQGDDQDQEREVL